MAAEEKDYTELLRRRALKHLIYGFVLNGVLRPLTRRFFDVRIEGAEHIPGRSCVIATHHCLSFDWVMLGVVLPRKAHGWIDQEVLRRVPRFGAALELICVNTDGGAESRKDYRVTREISRAWLEHTDELVVTVTDGPSKHLVGPDGRITPLPERPNHSGAASLGHEVNVPVVPCATWIPACHQAELFESKGIRGDLRYLERHRRIPYYCAFLEPVTAAAFRSRREMRDEIRRRQLAGYARLAEQHERAEPGA